MTLKNLHLFGIGVLTLIVMSGFAVLWGGPDKPNDPIVVKIASASTKKEWIEDALKRFNAASKSDRSFQVNGNPITIEILQEEIEPGVWDHYRSGTLVTDILSGKIQPVAASPGEGTWLRKLNSDWKGVRGSAIFTDEPTPLLLTPVIIAMWQSRAVALGCWPVAGPQCTWRSLSELSADPRGWASYGHPEWGKFRFGYGYVGESNSGTSAALMFCMAGLGKTAELRIEDIDENNGCGQSLTKVEKAKVHSGIKSEWLLNLMKEKGQTYLDAVVTNEQDVIEFNRANGSGQWEPLVVAYPQDGTVVRNDPYVVLDRAPWVTPEQARAARLFQSFLLSDAEQKKLPDWGLRPKERVENSAPPIGSDKGANPEASFYAVPAPDGPVFDRLNEVWHGTKKHAVIALVVDRSSSLDPGKLDSTKEGLIKFIEALDPQDYLLWMPFDESVHPGVSGSVYDIRETLVSLIKKEKDTGGGSSLYDAISEAYSNLEGRRMSLGDSVRYGIIVLTDGRDTKSKVSFTQLRTRLDLASGDPTGIQIHTIGVSEDARTDILKIIANTAHGRYWDASDPKRLSSIYTRIAVYY